MFTNIDLKKCFIDEKFFGYDNDTIKIIDNYNILEINKSGMDFYLENFEGVGCNNIEIYYKASIKSKDKEKLEKVTNWEIIEQLAGFLDFNPEVLISICALLKIDFDKNNIDLREYGVDKYNTRTVKFTPLTLLKDRLEKRLLKSVELIYKLKQIGIELSFHPYGKIEKNEIDQDMPSGQNIHGRYWLTNSTGLLVDGSLNSYGKDYIIAQKMDDINYSIVSSLFHYEIKPYLNKYVYFGVEEILVLTDRVYSLLNEPNPFSVFR